MTTINFTDEISLRGELTITKLPIVGEEEVLFEDKNLIMDRAKAHLLTLIYDTTGTNTTDPIAEFRLGSGGVYNAASISAVKQSDPKMTDLFSPLLPSAGAVYNPEDLTHDRITNDPGYLVDSFPTDVTFAFTITPNDLVGYGINEAGLITQSGRLFNHKTFPTITKDSDFSLQFTWTIKYN